MKEEGKIGLGKRKRVEGAGEDLDVKVRPWEKDEK